MADKNHLEAVGERAAGGPALGRWAEFLLLPNLLSASRIVLTPVFVGLMVAHKAWPAFWVFLAAGATDALDGLTARWLGLKTTLGLWLDPIGDKVLLTAAFIVLTIPELGRPNALPLWLTAICVGRDAVIAAGALAILAIRGRRNFHPVLAGKASTVCQVIVLYLVLFANAVGRSPGALAWLYVLTAALTAASFVQYGVLGADMLRKRAGPAGL